MYPGINPSEWSPYSLPPAVPATKDVSPIYRLGDTPYPGDEGNTGNPQANYPDTTANFGPPEHAGNEPRPAAATHLGAVAANELEPDSPLQKADWQLVGQEAAGVARAADKDPAAVAASAQPEMAVDEQTVRDVLQGDQPVPPKELYRALRAAGCTPEQADALTDRYQASLQRLEQLQAEPPTASETASAAQALGVQNTDLPAVKEYVGAQRLHEAAMNPPDQSLNGSAQAIAQEADFLRTMLGHSLRELADLAGVSRDAALKAARNENPDFQRIPQNVQGIDVLTKVLTTLGYSQDDITALTARQSAYWAELALAQRIDDLAPTTEELHEASTILGISPGDIPADPQARSACIKAHPRLLSAIVQMREFVPDNTPGPADAPALQGIQQSLQEHRVALTDLLAQYPDIPMDEQEVQAVLDPALTAKQAAVKTGYSYKQIVAARRLLTGSAPAVIQRLAESPPQPAGTAQPSAHQAHQDAAPEAGQSVSLTPAESLQAITTAIERYGIAPEELLSRRQLALYETLVQAGASRQAILRQLRVPEVHVQRLERSLTALLTAKSGIGVEAAMALPSEAAVTTPQPVWRRTVTTLQIRLRATGMTPAQLAEATGYTVDAAKDMLTLGWRPAARTFAAFMRAAGYTPYELARSARQYTVSQERIEVGRRASPSATPVEAEQIGERILQARLEAPITPDNAGQELLVVRRIIATEASQVRLLISRSVSEVAQQAGVSEAVCAAVLYPPRKLSKYPGAASAAKVLAALGFDRAEAAQLTERMRVAFRMHHVEPLRATRDELTQAGRILEVKITRVSRTPEGRIDTLTENPPLVAAIKRLRELSVDAPAEPHTHETRIRSLGHALNAFGISAEEYAAVIRSRILDPALVGSLLDTRLSDRHVAVRADLTLSEVRAMREVLLYNANTAIEQLMQSGAVQPPTPQVAYESLATAYTEFSRRGLDPGAYLSPSQLAIYNAVGAGSRTAPPLDAWDIALTLLTVLYTT